MWRDLPLTRALRLRRAVALAALALLCCGPAAAHDAFGSSKSVLTGFLHLVTSPLSIAAVAGLALALLGLEEPWSLVCAAAAGLGTAFAAALPAQVSAYAAPGGVVLVGLTAAIGQQPGRWLAPGLALCAGLAAGKAVELDAVTWEAVIGASGTVVFVTGCALVAHDDIVRFPWVRRILPIARRVLGSWVAAIGLLLGALAIRAG